MRIGKTAHALMNNVKLHDERKRLRLRKSPAGNQSPLHDAGVHLYVNESTFNLYVTQTEENVLWNIEKKGQKPGRLAVPQQRITVRGDGMGTAPVIPLAYLTVLSAKLVAMAFPNEQTAAELSDYDDERVMIVLGERLQTILEDLAGMPDGDDGASPVS